MCKDEIIKELESLRNNDFEADRIKIANDVLEWIKQQEQKANERDLRNRTKFSKWSYCRNKKPVYSR